MKITATTLTLRAETRFFASKAHADTFGSRLKTFDITLVTIGNPGNAADKTSDKRTNRQLVALPEDATQRQSPAGTFHSTNKEHETKSMRETT